MAQGNLKVKTKKPDLSVKNKNKGSVKSGKVTKKGQKNIAPKKASKREIHKIQKNIEKSINKNIEEQLVHRAHQFEEKKFNIVKNPKASTSKK